MIGTELRELQQALNQKADAVQQAFVAASEQLHAVARRLIEARGEGEEPILAEQETLRSRQVRLAAEVNAWREQARMAIRQPDEAALRAYLADLLYVNDAPIRAAAEVVLHILDHPDEVATGRPRARPQTATPASRLIERAREEFDLRGAEPEPRQRAAVEFANRPGVSQNDIVLAELEAALEDPDPIVKEVVTLTVIQMHRFRAMRLGDLDIAQVSVQWLARMRHRAALPVLIEIAATPRTGYSARAGQMVEQDNLPARLTALASLVEWRSPQAQAAIRARQHDPDPAMEEAARRALEAFPGEWR
jgi:hypothetical protein